MSGSLRVGEELSVLASYLDSAGCGVAELGTGTSRREIAVPGLFPGERARVRIAHLSRQQPRGRGGLLALEHASDGRREPPCPRHQAREGACTGCALMGLAPPSQREAKRETLVRRHGFVVDRIVAADELGYRQSSKRIVAGRPGAVVLGSYVRGSHRVADMTGCLVDHPRIVACADELVREANSAGIEPYDERSGRGDLRYVWLRTNGVEALVTLVTAAAPSRAASVLAGRLREPAAVWWSVHGEADNALRGATACPLGAARTLRLGLVGESIEVGPLGFVQPTPAVAAVAAADLAADPTGEPARGELAFDLYAGAGLATRLLRRRFARVESCDAHPESAAALGCTPERADAFLRRRLELDARPDLVVANPPRAGLGDAVCAALSRLAPPRLTLMSCHPGSLERDLRRLARTHTLVQMRAYDTLPQTPHVELVAWLRLSSRR